MLYCINLPLYLLQDCQSGTSIYQKIKNLLTLILMKTSIYSKTIEILKHFIYQNSCIKFLTYQFFWKIIKYYQILTYKCVFVQLRFHEYLDTETGNQKVEFRWSLCTQISPGWWLEFKSGVKVEINWSFENEFWNPSFHPDLVKTGILKGEFKSNFFTQISSS